jgi:hypothetical protein
MSNGSGGRLVSIALSAGLATGGCSWAFMTKPPDVVAAPQFPVDCTSSRTAPLLDTICGGYFVLNAISVAGAKECSSNPFAQEQGCLPAEAKAMGVPLSIGLAVLCTGAAIGGFGSASRCADMKAQNVGCIAGDPESCRALKPGWTPATDGRAPVPIIPVPVVAPGREPASP